jgi:ATP-dependent Clp protease ATP-binding subunit ClpB
MRIERFTQRAQEAIVAAQQLATEEGNPQLEAIHLLYSLVEQPDGVVPAVIERLGHEPGAVAERLRAEIGRLPKVQGETQLTLSDEARRILSDSHPLAERMHDEFVSTEHLLLAILEVAPRCAAAGILGELGIDQAWVLLALTAISGSQRVTCYNR